MVWSQVHHYNWSGIASHTVVYIRSMDNQVVDVGGRATGVFFQYHIPYNQCPRQQTCRFRSTRYVHGISSIRAFRLSSMAPCFLHVQPKLWLLLKVQTAMYLSVCVLYIHTVRITICYSIPYHIGHIVMCAYISAIVQGILFERIKIHESRAIYENYFHEKFLGTHANCYVTHDSYKKYIHDEH